MTTANPSDYIAELQRAMDFTREIGLTRRRGFRPADPVCSDEFCSILRDWARINVCSRPPDRIAGRCVHLSMELAEFLGAARIPAIYTLGWMSYRDVPLFRFGEDDVRTWLRHGLPNRDRLELHAWITLASGEVIDASWLSTVGVVRNRPELVGAVIVAAPHHRTVHRYHPVVVDFPIVDALRLTPLLQDARQVARETA